MTWIELILDRPHQLSRGNRSPHVDLLAYRCRCVHDGDACARHIAPARWRGKTAPERRHERCRRIGRGLGVQRGIEHARSRSSRGSQALGRHRRWPLRPRLPRTRRSRRQRSRRRRRARTAAYLAGTRSAARWRRRPQCCGPTTRAAPRQRCAPLPRMSRIRATRSGIACAVPSKSRHTDTGSPGAGRSISAADGASWDSIAARTAASASAAVGQVTVTKAAVCGSGCSRNVASRSARACRTNRRTACRGRSRRRS